MTEPQANLPTIDQLFDEYDGWRATAARDSDDFDSLTKLAAFYKFVIAHHAEPGGDLLRQAAAQIQTAEKDRT
ncbi:hypothetical protein HQ351_14330 [Rhodococcus sp. BP-258]|uniref:hypothetical protein n=1 Tax=unclassified Rhodococcus (in: high G+C Gram-positive bacteria) TaxID=192944 RepID=UPI001C9B4FE7|nr:MULTISPECIES: hypothetical protein [unclassified Rhodococcus (in: high G+C Gram-positive bacteria)]MBY6454761.1 hypothetical protein [Rhodococcus sp. BP-277]MBY6465307.1 hypothetical protein [Rhodococcus sp. BP-290]MBY6495681.1 hypothetical protein [Rhodococcus sp. BP-314]MBY6529943.1 hypothetical protein [Rhodococcus sp. BP-258]